MVWHLREFDTSVLLEKGKWNISAGKGRPHPNPCCFYVVYWTINRFVDCRISLTISYYPMPTPISFPFDAQVLSLLTSFRTSASICNKCYLRFMYYVTGNVSQHVPEVHSKLVLLGVSQGFLMLAIILISYRRPLVEKPLSSVCFFKKLTKHTGLQLASHELSTSCSRELKIREVSCTNKCGGDFMIILDGFSHFSCTNLDFFS